LQTAKIYEGFNTNVLRVYISYLYNNIKTKCSYWGKGAELMSDISVMLSAPEDKMNRYWRIFIIFCILLVFCSCSVSGGSKSENIFIKSNDANQDYFVFIKYRNFWFQSNKYGYMNSRGEVVIPPNFEYAEDFVDGMAIVKTGNGYGVIDKSGRYILQPIYSGCKLLGNGLIAYEAYKWKLKDAEGKDIGALEFDDIMKFSEGLAAVKIGDKWGFINTGGELVIEPVYDFAANFEDSLCSVQINDRWGLIDIYGNKIVEPVFQNRLWIVDDYILVQGNDGKWGYLDNKGEQVIDYKFEKALNFREGLAPVYREGKWGYIDKQGNFAIEPDFDEAKEFANGLALVKKENKFYYINMEGTIVKETDMYYTEMYDFYDQMVAIMKDGKYGFINENMEIVVEPEYDDYKNFSEGFGIVGKKIDGSYDTIYGYVDKTGKWLVEPSFTDAEPFKGGLARAWKSGMMGYIDSKGNFVYKPWNY